MARERQENLVSDDEKFDAKKFSDDLRDKIHNGIHVEINARDDKQKKRGGPVFVGIGIHGRGLGLQGGGMAWGVILILVGLAFLFDHLGYIHVERLWRFWPMLLIFAGVINIMSRERRFWGVILLIAGGFLQLNQLGIAHFGWADFWPLVLIAAGFLVLWGSIEARKNPRVVSSAGDDPRKTLNEAVVFGGLERRVTTQDFQGGRINAVFGGVEIDLRDAKMQAEEAVLELNVVFGGVELRVPDTWQVAYRGSPIFGGIEDKTRTSTSSDPANPAVKALILTGAVIFGGVEIKN
jgi:predicted membrane protein